MKEEIWKDVVGYKGMYQVSNLGRVRSLDRVNSKGKRFKGKMLTLLNNGNGYMRVKLCKEGTYKSFLVHRLVAEAFLEIPEGYYEVNHLDVKKDNNNVENLEVCDRTENLLHAWSGNSFNKLKKEDVLYIREHYNRNDEAYNSIAMAQKFGVTPTQIYNVVSKRSHKNV